MLKTFLSDKINVTKHVLFFLLRVPTHQSFTFDSRYLYELKHKVHLSESMRRILHFQFCLIFIKVFILVKKKSWTL